MTDEWVIWVHHVGGIGEAGPTGALSKLGDVKWVVYDALEKASASSRAWDPNYRVVNKAIGNSTHIGTMHVTADPSASSLLKPAASAEDYSVMVGDGSLQVWGVHAEVKETLPVEVRSLDSLVADGTVPPVDFLSIDAQGAELDILTGAKNALYRAIGVILEVEYARLYEGQPLFSETHMHLASYGFRLCDIMNVQYMNVAPYSPELLGAGFMTVGEAFYLKELSSLSQLGFNRSTVIRALKLAAVALAFDRLDYALMICRSLGTLDETLVGEGGKIKYVALLRDLALAAKAVERESPPIIQRPGEEGKPRKVVPVPSVQADAVSKVLFQYGLNELATKRMFRQSTYRSLRGVVAQ